MKKSATKKDMDTQLRERYGWTQEQLAAYLGVSRSHLSLYEMGERMLPADKSGKWLEIVQFTYGGDTLTKAKADLVLPAPGTEKLQQRAEACEWEAQKWQRKLAAMQKKYEQAVNNIALCQHLLGLTADTPENEATRRQLQLTLAVAVGTQQYEGMETLALLQCKIEGLLYEAQRCREKAAIAGDKETVKGSDEPY